MDTSMREKKEEKHEKIYNSRFMLNTVIEIDELNNCVNVEQLLWTSKYILIIIIICY